MCIIPQDIGGKAGVNHCFPRRQARLKQSRWQTPKSFLSHSLNQRARLCDTSEFLILILILIVISSLLPPSTP